MVIIYDHRAFIRMVTGLLPANLIVGPKFKQDTMQDAGVKLADGVKEDTTD